MNRDEQIRAVRGSQRPSAPRPEQVDESKARHDRGERLPDDRQSRPWYCRSCGHTESGPVIPEGWYSVTRHSGSYDVKPARLGIYCSAACLDAQIPRLIGVEADAGNRWQASAERRS